MMENNIILLMRICQQRLPLAMMMPCLDHRYFDLLRLIEPTWESVEKPISHDSRNSVDHFNGVTLSILRICVSPLSTATTFIVAEVDGTLLDEECWYSTASW